MAAQMDRVPLGSASIKLTTIHLSPKIGGKGEAIPVKAHCLLLIVPGLACLGVLGGGRQPRSLPAGALRLRALFVDHGDGPRIGPRVGSFKMRRGPAGATPLAARRIIECSSRRPDTEGRFLIAVSGPLTHIP